MVSSIFDNIQFLKNIMPLLDIGLGLNTDI